MTLSPQDIWTEHLTDKQLDMLVASGEKAPARIGNLVDLHGAGKWATARSLERHGLGLVWLGSYFNTSEGIRILHEFDPDPFPWEVPSW